ncbi:MAG TPA: alanine--tRNA ligase, partial [Vicinamibacterales bacterium]|nr:alanine--tRNA ligase [Vicinamibacterales bacterium]
MTVNEIRASFLKFFESRGHRIVPSSPLVPADDPTLLFTNAGMNQFKDALLGREKREYTRATTCQKIMRVSGKHNDLDNVGPSHRHHTFFEMLGNFSFGDYFKQEAIPFAWELLTDVWKMPKDKFVVSIFKGEDGIPRDDEAYDIWRKLGIPADRILELGSDDNFWSMGDTGPCGRCSEIYFVRGGSGIDPEIEIWNNVFMEFERSADGTLTPLPAPAIDTGMGLERMTAVMQNVHSDYDTDCFRPLLEAIGEMSGHRYGADESIDVSMRVVADHIRSTAFLIGDGVIPSNEWRGYVLRKIMRRAMRHGKHLGLNEPFMHRLVPVLDAQMGGAYPELRSGREMIEKTILAEEDRFEAVLRDGLPRLEAELAKVSGTRSKTLSGETAFKLYDTFGVPFDFIEDTAATQGVAVDKAAFEHAMEGQRDKARAKSTFGGGAKDVPFVFGQESPEPAAGDTFEGYAATRVTGVPIVAMWNADRQPGPQLGTGDTGYIALARTPFYLEAGGQVSDAGRITNAAGAVASVEGLARTGAGTPRAHQVRVTHGTLTRRDIVTAEVDVEARDATRRNH